MSSLGYSDSETERKKERYEGLKIATKDLYGGMHDQAYVQK
jgi:hypothetical protein